MNTQNLILTSTAKMTRSEWLEFRKPLTHVKKWISEYLFKKNISFDFDYLPSQLRYDILIEIFKSDEWKEFVFPCIGGSEIAAVHGLNKYQSSIELYFKKVGVWPTEDIDNAAMFWGRELEEQIAEKWQYWDGNVEGMISNFTIGFIVRKCTRVNAYIQNKAFPFISVSLDRRINKTGDIEGVLECKTISGYAADQWEAGIPPMYVIQLQTQLAVTELPFGEIAILQDGRAFEVLPFERNENIIAGIIEKNRKFFEDVKKGIEFYLLSLVAPDEETKRNNLAIIDRLAPEPDGSISYEAYLKQKNEDKGYEINGGEQEYIWAVEHEKLSTLVDETTEKKREFSNKLKNAMGEASTMSFGERGRITWKANKNGIRVFKMSLKDV